MPYPQYDSVYGPELWEWNTPQGYSQYDSLVAKAEKRFTGNGLCRSGVGTTQRTKGCNPCVRPEPSGNDDLGRVY